MTPESRSWFGCFGFIFSLSRMFCMHEKCPSNPGCTSQTSVEVVLAEHWEQLIGTNVVIRCMSAIWQWDYHQYSWDGPFPPPASSGRCGPSASVGGVWWTPSLWISLQGRPVSQQFSSISAGLASIPCPDALKGDLVCVLFMFPVCRYASMRLSSNRFFGFVLFCF